jgi:hypothetical protein
LDIGYLNFEFVSCFGFRYSNLVAAIGLQQGDVMLEKYWIHELTRPAFAEWLEGEKSPVVVIGLGSVEQHGPHLPLGTDSLTAWEHVQEVARRSNSVCVLPCFLSHHIGFP